MLNLNLKNWTAKQKIMSGVVLGAVVLGGVGGGYLHHESKVHAQQVAHQKALKNQERAEKEKAALKAQTKKIDALIASATENPTDQSIQAASEAVSKIKNNETKAAYQAILQALTDRLTLIKAAQAAVKDYQNHATDAKKQSTAQAAINALKDKHDQDVKAQLQKQFDESNKQAQAAAKAAQTHASSSATKPRSQTQVQTASTNVQNSSEGGGAASQGGTSYSTSQGGGVSQGSPSQGGGQTGVYASVPAAPARTSTPAATTPSIPAAPASSQPYPLNPYHGNGILEPSDYAANLAGDQALDTGKYHGYDVVGEYWSDGSERVYLELY